MKKIVVLGGGYGGVLTAKKLAKKFKKSSDVEITLIDRKPYHTLLTELHEVAANRVEEDSVKIDLKKIFAGRKVNVVLDEVDTIDFEGKKLNAKNKDYDYDYLVIGTGCKPSYFGISGAEEHAFPLWSFEDAVHLREQIRGMFMKGVQQTDPAIRKEMLTFVVVGAGFTGIEMIGELAEYKKELCKENYIDESEVRLVVADMAPKILPILPDKLIKKAEKHLGKLDVEIVTSAQITGVTPNGVILGEKGEIASRTVIWTAGVEGSELVGKLDVAQQGRKRIVTNDKLQSVDHEHVYVVGDNIFFIPEGEERPVPQMVENAEAAAPIVANNIWADVTGNNAHKKYKPTFHGCMVCIGSRYGVANVGMPGKMFAMSGFFAMFIKHFINCFYLVQVAGYNKVFSYCMHEFFNVKNNRSFLGGHFAKRSPNFWLFPLRIYIGYMWLSQGLEKLPKVWKNPSDIFLIPPKVVDGVTAASQAVTDVHNTVDASSAASAVQGASTAIQALPVPEFITKMMNWSMDLMFYTSDGGYTTLATVFQTAMVLGEVVFGTLLILGLFTALSSVGTVAMGAMIWVSGMAPYEMLWYLAGGIALIGGSGSTLGADYYVLPRLKRIWKKIPIVKKWYIFND
ncbi:6-phosphogluconate dehydrogenase [Paenibacillus albiflavus]|uniref:NADH:ubiquinone reductase (non-electrogenic) n=1 Tax=Paenibacillus albiflavus TaxID=2545760 RepID=A0A4R4EDW3_9BACL|nr:FAD-dependent oxidoreductase [Paenibacillus albiflavus]TCZ76351.1 6-phosphogluconate dehydrogenase [Paenibacillus albiflavus]